MLERATLAALGAEAGRVRYVPIARYPGIERLPFSLRVVLENLLRQQFFEGVENDAQVQAVLQRETGAALTFKPTRIYGQDILAKVMLVDMAGLRDALAAAGRDPGVVNPAVPVDIVIDHSLQVDFFGTRDAPRLNLEMEYRRNAERFEFLRWCSESFERVRVVPPGKGIMHQIHLEKIGQVVWTEELKGMQVASPDTCVGTDSHTPMINGLGLLGWGVGGIEAEAVMLGKGVAMALPRVIGVEVKGKLREGVMPTDLVLTITERLRKVGVVGEFVEFFGTGMTQLSVADRGTIANMAPEYGATAVYFPIDQRSIEYLRMTARPAEQIALVEAYARAQKLWRDETTPAPAYDLVVEVDLADIRPSMAGPKNPEDRFDLADAATAFVAHSQAIAGREPAAQRHPVAGADFAIRDGDLAIAAITSCTNTSNPVGMIAAGLVARNAARLGLKSKPWVKTSLAPGSHVVAEVLERCGLQRDLDALGFQVVGFGCTTCNGGSGPLPQPIADAIENNGVVATAVLSGNRNFQGRIHPNVRAAYLASPALVVAYAIAGSMTVDITREPIGISAEGKPVFLADIWPSFAEIDALVASAYTPDVFTEKYADLFDGGEPWAQLATKPSALFSWQPGSSYVRQPPYFAGLSPEPSRSFDIRGARPLVILGDSITTDDISPSGAISLGTPSADLLLSYGVKKADFNNYTTRRANHEVAVRATFANIRLRNRIIPGIEGGFTRVMPEGEQMRIFEAAQAYMARGTPLVVIAGKNYGCGSSRDWAAKGVALLGVKAVIAEGFERIHRTNLVGMGVLPLQFAEGVLVESFDLDGSETYDIAGLDRDFAVRDSVSCKVTRSSGETLDIPLIIRLDTPEDIAYWRHGGILPFVWRDYMGADAPIARTA
ncbi:MULTISPECIES: aconitate hydratase AcnA [Bosea]|uniref:aconitate hydratase AcnA n=1 Tax=Bosea TaxID=85413 RepID=UPI00214FC827|nr:MULTISPECIES: aconitate hydratase AcnA [Bosea]MCR4524106.1 aconitate hydratase AcnA [Bosea sp. 47.2.35]MDR6827484.1 aconitate hydratase [Bosea robiniae]MDR6894194.1 aconitate hydratase [Bosea sp. BE109]MDR7137589.1 aconitate hydratase [Bosea sp. BE168]MDR7174289.1 aconitate hydratase [Bosea sp. BE271]